ncbi:biotin/lipoyl-containing protein [Rhodosalinus sediminis]|uniref:biotin/lipoyl-containing protein n=1 Tax=Rhodosalinus sediminis TaxID=1940533 RepID=UPI0023559E88|nr:biotin/lipoyl-containing protein [Rhodosalinus sediminis]
MPHDVTMPQLGMAQDAGKIVSWAKAPGDAVAAGEALFEVETDKAVMEVEAPAEGYLSAVAYGDGAEVPVGAVIARIVADAGEVETAAPAPEAHGERAPEAQEESAPDAGAPEAGAALPEGHPVTMPQLGMAQDAGLLVSWLKAPGERVAAEDVLFEVETDKSTMEVEAGRAGWLAATLAQAGEEVPVGEPVALLSETEPAAPVARSVTEGAAPATAPAAGDTTAAAGGASGAAAPAAAATAASPAAQPGAQAAPTTATATATAATAARSAAGAAPGTAPAAAAAPQAAGGRILASPKARRRAAEEGLDLARLAAAGHPQPYHVADLDVLRAMPAAPDAAPDAAFAAPPRRLTATVTDGLAAFAAWAAEAEGLAPGAVLAGLAGASLGAGERVTVAVERMGATQAFTVPPGRALSAVAEAAPETPPALVVRDLRGTPLASVALGAEAAPVLTILAAGADTGTDTGARTDAGPALSITLECAAGALDAGAAIRCLTDFAGRVEQPLRHLL